VLLQAGENFRLSCHFVSIASVRKFKHKEIAFQGSLHPHSSSQLAMTNWSEFAHHGSPQYYSRLMGRERLLNFVFHQLLSKMAFCRVSNMGCREQYILVP